AMREIYSVLTRNCSHVKTPPVAEPMPASAPIPLNAPPLPFLFLSSALTSDDKFGYRSGNKTKCIMNAINMVQCVSNNCPVVFTGHYHAINGFWRNYQGSGRKKIPVYLSGSPSYSKYLKVRFEDDKITITKINAVLGKAEEYGTPTVINVK
ncbi:MAG: hypothetical protein VXW15_02825, partial [Bdellovibrionota bacterium]|nr:hypothetical protein [Bdellovibrionota bacterium]